MLPKLFKKSSTGKLLEWVVVVGEDKDKAYYTITHGQVGGKLQETTVNVYDGKNIGKANETTRLEQAQSDAQSKWNKQIDKGYKANAGDLQSSDADLKPMLAEKYKDFAHKIKFPAFVSPKLDGLRCITNTKKKKKESFSRGGKPIDSIGHIHTSLVEYEDIFSLDGELYNHEVKFQKIISNVKRKQEDTGLIQYHVYDVMIPHETFATRYKFLQENLPINESVKLVPAYVVNNEDDILRYFKQFLEEGYEGAMVRANDCKYKHGRSQELLKFKEFSDDEFEIVGVTNGVGKCENQAVFVCVTKEGSKFNCKIKGPDEYREEILLKPKNYIGQQLTVSYFGLTDDGLPRFPVGLKVKDELEL